MFGLLWQINLLVVQFGFPGQKFKSISVDPTRFSQSFVVMILKLKCHKCLCLSGANMHLLLVPSLFTTVYVITPSRDNCQSSPGGFLWRMPAIETGMPDICFGTLPGVRGSERLFLPCTTPDAVYSNMFCMSKLSGFLWKYTVEVETVYDKSVMLDGDSMKKLPYTCKQFY